MSYIKYLADTQVHLGMITMVWNDLFMGCVPTFLLSFALAACGTA